MFRLLALAAWAWSTPLHAGETDCRQFYSAVDSAISRADVRDAQDSQVKGYPYLRSNRFLAGEIKIVRSDEQLDFLLQQMITLEQRARGLELHNLPAAELARLERMQREMFPSQSDISTALDECGKALIAIDRAQPAAIKRAACAPIHYSLLKRLLGFYPLTAIPFSRGIRKFQTDTSAAFTKNISASDRDPSTMVYTAQDAQPVDAAAILRDSSDNPLHIPLPSPDQLAQLFDQFAPNFAIANHGDFDRPGAVGLGNNGKSTVDTSTPKIYVLASHTRFAEQTLLQLNYVIWFSERPKKGKFDMLGGALDGLIWRVTLTPDGEPLLYDSIHPCGCYHLFFPTDKLRAKPRHPSLQEHAYVPQAAPHVNPGERLTIWVESGTHYIVRVTASEANPTRAGITYQLADYDELRSLSQAEGTRRSLFRSDGLIHGSERGERIFFWPMGIASAGAMRQWGHHATAFVGMRHFDDPDLIDKAFE